MVDYFSVLEKHYSEVGFGLEDNSYNSIQLNMEKFRLKNIWMYYGLKWK